MTLRDYEQPWAPELASQLGEPILRCMAINAAGVGDAFISRASRRPFWRPRMMVNGQRRNRLPLTMFLILTPSRVLITKMENSMGFRPNLSAPILTLQRGDAEITATRDDDGLWLYSLRSRATAEEVGLELMAYGDIADGLAEELAGQLRNFSVAPSPVRYASGLSDKSEADDNSLLGRRRRSIARSTRVGAIITALFALGFLGFGAFELYGYHSGRSTTATNVSCYSKASATSCKGDWTMDEKTYTGRVMGPDSSPPYGSSVDVRVSHGIAFTGAFPMKEFIWGGFWAVFTIVVLWWPSLRRRGHRY
jgi:hypothetical protein